MILVIKVSYFLLSRAIFLKFIFDLFFRNEFLKCWTISSFVSFKFTFGGASSLNNLNHNSLEGFVWISPCWRKAPFLRNWALPILLNPSWSTKSEINQVPKQFVLMLDFRKLPYCKFRPNSLKLLINQLLTIS